MAEFAPAVHQTIFENEGGAVFVDDPDDPGGATRWGISLRFCREEFAARRVALSFQIPLTGCDIRTLTLEQAEEIYRVCWWDLYGYGRLEDQRVAGKLFDASVNMGPMVAHQIAQLAVNSCGADVVVDGHLGPISVLAINVCNPDKWLMAACARMRQHYRAIVAVNFRKAKFLNGWLARAAWTPKPKDGGELV